MEPTEPPPPASSRGPLVRPKIWPLRPAFTKSFWKDPKGTHRVERIKRSMGRANREKTAKQIAKELDGWCRWPHAHGERQICRRSRLDGAHLVAKSVAGSPGNVPENIIAFCEPVHMGAKSLHSDDRRVVPLDLTLGTRGPCRFLEKVRGLWIVVGEELRPHVWAWRLGKRQRAAQLHFTYAEDGDGE